MVRCYWEKAMGKLYLTPEELEQFPTIRDVSVQGFGKDPKNWGLYLDPDNNICFGERSSQCFIQHTLEEIFEELHITYGEEYNKENILLTYFFNMETEMIDFDFIELSLYEDLRSIHYYDAELPAIVH